MIFSKPVWKVAQLILEKHAVASCSGSFAPIIYGLEARVWLGRFVTERVHLSCLSMLINEMVLRPFVLLNLQLDKWIASSTRITSSG